MSAHRFDAFAKALAASGSRRTALQATGVGIVAGLLGVPTQRAHAQDASPTTEETEWLLTIGFHSAELIASMDTPGRATVTLTGVDTDVLAFTDHPERQVGLLPVADFPGIVADSADDPLNADLVAREPLRREHAQLVLLLRSADVDAGSGALELHVDIIGTPVGGESVASAEVESRTLAAGFLFVDGISTSTNTVIATIPVGEGP